jgi:hypothetical protein
LIVFGVGTSVRLATRLYNSGYRTTPRILRLTFVCESCHNRNNSCRMCQRTYERLGACRACKPDVDLDMSPPIQRRKKEKSTRRGRALIDHRPLRVLHREGNSTKPRDVCPFIKEKKHGSKCGSMLPCLCESRCGWRDSIVRRWLLINLHNGRDMQRVAHPDAVRLREERIVRFVRSDDKWIQINMERSTGWCR